MLTDLDGVTTTMEILEILRCFAFVSTRFGYSAFSEYNFVYLSSIDILSSAIPQTTTFIQKHIPPPQTPSPAIQPSHTAGTTPPRQTHPAIKANTLFFLDTLEYFIPVLSAQQTLEMVPVVRRYLGPVEGVDKKILESAHSVFLAILARGDISIPHEPYIQTIYSVPPPVPFLPSLHSPFLPFPFFYHSPSSNTQSPPTRVSYLSGHHSNKQSFPQALSPRQLRLAFSTLTKLSPTPQTTTTKKPMLGR